MDEILFCTSIASFIWILGYFHNGKYIRPKWKIPGKFIFYTGISAALTYWFGYYSLLFVIGHPLIGLLFHIRICKKYKINWVNCKPKEKYLKLHDKWSKGDFS